MKADRNSKLRSETVQEILNSRPNWIIRWGITIIFLLIVATLIVASYIYYPNTRELHGKIRINDGNVILYSDQHADVSANQKATLYISELNQNFSGTIVDVGLDSLQDHFKLEIQLSEQKRINELTQRKILKGKCTVHYKETSLLNRMIGSLKNRY